MSLPLLHAGRTNPGLSAALDLRFALDKSLTAYRGPTPSFSRASTGSYFDGSGVLRYATVNILTYSENFSDASWLKNSTTISSDSVIAPDGKTTADTLTSTSSTAIHYLEKTGYTVSTVQYTISIFAKYGTHRYLQISANNESSGVYANFNLFSGVVGSVGASATSQITNVGGGWYRCSMTYTSTNTASRPLLVMVSSSTAPRVESTTLTSGDYFYIWGCQQEASSTVGTYCPTTSSANSAPRFDHTFNGTSWVSRGLLVEEQRTNSSPYSVTFNSGNAPWGVADLSISLNSATAPDGTNTATKIIEGTGAGNHNIYRVFPFTGTITWSIFAKAAERNYIQIFIGNLNSPETGINVDLTNGAITNQSPSVVASGTQDVGNGWYRIWFSVTGSGGTYYPAVGTSNSATGIRSSYTGNGTSGVYIWGAQWESGSFPTSYIENSGSGSTTRSADVCQITGTDFSGLWNGTEGSIIAEADFIGVESANDKYIFSASNTTTPSNTFISAGSNVNSSGNFGSNGYISGAEQFAFSNSANPPANSPFKYALAIKQNDFASVYNGASVLSDASGNVTSVQIFSIGMLHNFGRQFCGHIARLRYYRKRLPNATLQLLSEPDPTLNLQFALNKSLTPVAGPAPSFSRASTGTFFNASGVLTSASINTPRFDHVFSGGQWVSRGLLIEEQRTNGLLQSNGFGNSPWTIASSRGTVTQNAASPDGTNNAWTGNCTVTAPGGFYLIQGGLSSPSATYTLSFFAKKDNNGFVAIEAGETSNDVYVFFDLTNGLSGNLSSVGGYTNISHGLSDCGNGWYRCRLTFTKSNSNNLTAYIYPTCNSFSSLSCTSGQSNFIFGAQYETGAFPTSYIGTTTSSVTRSADVCQITGTSFGWMWNQGEGSVAVEAGTFSDSSYLGRYLEFTRTSSVGSPSIGVGTINSAGSAGGDNVYNYVWDSSTQAALYASPARPLAKSSFAWKVNDFAASINGATALTDTSGTVPTGIDVLTIGSRYGSLNIINGHIAKLIYYPARLANTKLQQLST